jgi:polar amino acid transport system substrate-binding protein
MQLQSAIRDGLEQDAYEVCYQPKIELNTGKINGFEALVRFRHPTQGVLLPESFLGVAEDTGLIVQIGAFVMRKCCEDLNSWGRPELTVSINLSPRQFSDIGLVRKVEEVIAEYAIDPRSLEFEISEAAALKNIEKSVEIIERFKEMGISFSLDNFGTGYSSISFLKVLPVTGIKIDKTFIESVSSNRIDKRVIETMILLAQNLELIVVAQGVERDEQDNFLKAIHCDKAQGYLYGEPITSAQVKQMLSTDQGLQAKQMQGGEATRVDLEKVDGTA